MSFSVLLSPTNSIVICFPQFFRTPFIQYCILRNFSIFHVVFAVSPAVTFNARQLGNFFFFLFIAVNKVEETSF